MCMNVLEIYGAVAGKWLAKFQVEPMNNFRKYQYLPCADIRGTYTFFSLLFFCFSPEKHISSTMNYPPLTLWIHTYAIYFSPL